MASTEFAAIAALMSPGLPLRPACAVPAAKTPPIPKSATERTNLDAMLFVFMVSVSRELRSRSVFVFAREELAAHVDAQNQAVELIGGEALPAELSRVDANVVAVVRAHARAGLCHGRNGHGGVERAHVGVDGRKPLHR